MFQNQILESCRTTCTPERAQPFPISLAVCSTWRFYDAIYSLAFAISRHLGARLSLSSDIHGPDKASSHSQRLWMAARTRIQHPLESKVEIVRAVCMMRFRSRGDERRGGEVEKCYKVCCWPWRMRDTTQRYLPSHHLSRRLSVSYLTQRS
jgi:hypothetical protein